MKKNLYILTVAIFVFSGIKGAKEGSLVKITPILAAGASAATIGALLEKPTHVSKPTGLIDCTYEGFLQKKYAHEAETRRVTSALDALDKKMKIIPSLRLRRIAKGDTSLYSLPSAGHLVDNELRKLFPLEDPHFTFLDALRRLGSDFRHEIRGLHYVHEAPRTESLLKDLKWSKFLRDPISKMFATNLALYYYLFEMNKKNASTDRSPLSLHDVYTIVTRDSKC